MSETRSSPQADSRTPQDNRSNHELPECEIQPGDNLGRYQVVRVLGTGGFGHVLLAEDPKLRRQVAIKIPRADRLLNQKVHFLEEGRSVARLDHPSIIKVFNIEETDDGIPFAVMEYVEGTTLQHIIRHDGLSFSQSLDFLIQIADALAYAHGQTLIHRDLKPSNVIVGNHGQTAKLMDFGLAMHDLTPEGIISRSPEGTPPYMAPEQVRGENHRLDRRTDIWSFGVVMYVMLTGKRPFNSKSIKDLIDEICLREPRAPSRINSAVPAELERICLRCLEKLMGARYQTANELADDLRSFQSQWHLVETRHDSFSGVLPVRTSSKMPSGTSEHPSSTQPSEMAATDVVKVVPKGLRSFDSQDADFFIDLLPGPKDRFGVPDSLRFWTSRILGESTDKITVGLLFGPSGCGKSSFVKAGLLPRLNESVDSIYLEATPHETEQKLKEKLHSFASNISENESSLAVAMNRIRRGNAMKGKKLLIVIDQFEQWLHNHSDLSGQPLIEALRQCDGDNLCCLLMVRDDFWMSATQFMSQLDLKVQEGVNALGIPLFDRRHARKVLTAYGRASEAIGEEPTDGQLRFISDSVKEISENGRIIPIHLALFAQMMDSDSWDAAQLKRMGGWQGIGVHFLETIFADKRMGRHEQSSRAILRQLLPDENSEIKGAQKSVQQLASVTDENGGIEKIEPTIEILDRELRIITPTESEEGTSGQHYQLAHDFLVNPIRTWLLHREKETWQGRARIRLGELATQWQTKPQTRFLPSPVEYAGIMLGSPARERSEVENNFLRSASQFYGIRVAAFMIVTAIVIWGTWKFYERSQIRRAQERLSSLLIGGPAEVAARLELLEPFGHDAVNQLLSSSKPSQNSKERLHHLFARAHFGSPEEIDIQALVAETESADQGQCVNFVNALRPLVDHARQKELFDLLEGSYESTSENAQKVRLAIIAMHLGETDLLDSTLAFRKNPEIREQFIEIFPGWKGSLGEAVKTLEEITNEASLSGLGKAIGLVPSSEFSPTELARLNTIAQELHEHHLNASVHSASGWLIQKFGFQTPVTNEDPDDAAWFVERLKTGDNITFVQIESQIVSVGGGLTESEKRMFGQKRKDEFLDHGFFIASKEVSASLFMKFVDSLEDDDPTRKYFTGNVMDDHREINVPVYRVTWIEAVRFCNWLSQMEGRQPYYQKNESQWKPVESSNGFRLPTNLEWDAANRAGTETRFFFGDLSTRLSRYATIGDHEFAAPELNIGFRGEKMPNDYGLFDSTGNASEWCQDRNPRSNVSFRTLRGGQTLASTRWLTSGSMFDQSKQDRLTEPGLRIVLDSKNK